jgi:pimeloyl-ACP methyl ester carboxylesterase
MTGPLRPAVGPPWPSACKLLVIVLVGRICAAPTRFLDPKIPRVGSGVVLPQDAIDLLNALHLGWIAVVGHDWVARAAHALAALFLERISAMATLVLAYQPRGRFIVPGFAQARLLRYQWFQCTESGASRSGTT